MAAFDFGAFLGVADRLIAGTPGEADQRSAISRAYYAAFHVARAYLRRTLPAPPQRRLTHQHVWVLLRDVDDPSAARLADLGARLHDLRRNADYDASFPGRIGTAAPQAIEDCRNLIDGIGRLPG